MTILFKIRKNKKPGRLRMSEWELIDRESIESRKTEIERRGAVRTVERPPKERFPKIRLPKIRPSKERPPTGLHLRERPPGERPAREIPPKKIPPEEPPKVERPPIELPAIKLEPLELLRKEAPPREIPPREIPPKETPPAEIPPIEIPPRERPPVKRPPEERPPRVRPPVLIEPRLPRISLAMDRALLKFIEIGILALIVWVPLPKGSVHQWSILVMQIVVFAMVGAYVLVEEKPLDNEYLQLVLRWPRYLFSAVFVLIGLQVLPLPNFLMKLISPQSYYFRRMFVPEFSRVHFMSISLMPGHTLREGLELLTYFLLGFLIVKTVVRRKQIMRIFYFLVGMGVFQAIYGLFELYNPSPRILFYKKLHYLDCVTGTFVNRNHLSGYLEMTIPLAIGLILARTDFFSMADMKWPSRILQLSERGVYKNILLALGIVLMGLAVIFSKSRSGVFLLIFTFILVLGVSSLYYGRGRREFKWVKDFFKAVFLAILLVAVYIGIDATIDRFAMDKVLGDARPMVWSNTTGIIGDFPVLGSGLGTFQALYPAYEQSSTPPLFEHAHNDYLEYMAELGGLGFLLMLGGILVILVFSFLVWKVRRHPGVRGLALGGMVAVLVMLLHSITDFNLHIPANMMLFAVVISMTVATAFYKREEK